MPARHLALALIGALLAGPAAAQQLPCAPPRAIRFAPGANAASPSGALAGGDIACWTFLAKPGLFGDIAIDSPDGNAVFRFYPPGWRLGHDDDDAIIVLGAAYPGGDAGDAATHWAGLLVGTGPQLIAVASLRGDTQYRLRVTISRPPD